MKRSEVVADWSGCPGCGSPNHNAVPCPRAGGCAKPRKRSAGHNALVGDEHAPGHVLAGDAIIISIRIEHCTSGDVKVVPLSRAIVRGAVVRVHLDPSQGWIDFHRSNGDAKGAHRGLWRLCIESMRAILGKPHWSPGPPKCAPERASTEPAAFCDPRQTDLFGVSTK